MKLIIFLAIVFLVMLAWMLRKMRRTDYYLWVWIPTALGITVFSAMAANAVAYVLYDAFRPHKHVGRGPGDDIGLLLLAFCIVVVLYVASLLAVLILNVPRNINWMERGVLRTVFLSIVSIILSCFVFDLILINITK